jgi:hypothetical protein
MLLVLLLLAACSQRHLEESNIKLPAPTWRMSYPTSHFVGLPWCIGGTTLIKMIHVERRLTNGESWVIIGSCVVPVVGGYVVKRVWDTHPLWNEYPIDINGPIDAVPVYMRR